MSTWQFVDSIAASPTVRLDLNSRSGGLMLAEDPDVSPPRTRTASVASMLADGELIPARAFVNRTIRMTLQLVDHTTKDLAAAKLQALARELTRQPGNFLRVTVATNAMFFRTLPAPDAAYNLLLNAAEWGNATIEIPCEPFGYGLKETLTGVTVTNNPAAGSNGMFFDIASPKGDVECPLDLTIANGSTGLGAVGRAVSLFSVRRRGTPSATPIFLQAEAMTTGSNAAVQPNSASMSGSGSNYVQVASGASTMATRLSTTTRFPTTASVDARGTYRVLARVRQSATVDVWDMRLQYGTTNVVITNDTVRLPTPASAANFHYVDLTPGQQLMQIPIGVDPVYDGLSGVELPAEGNFLGVQIQHISGAGTLDVDVLLFPPADDRLGYVKWPEVQNFSSDTFTVSGGPRPTVFCRNTAGDVSPVQPMENPGGGLMITPGRSNRIFFIRDVGTGTATSGGGDSITASQFITASYYPRYLFPLRPAST